MEAVPIRPVDAEILFNESCPVAVHRLGEMNCFTLALPLSPQPPHLPFKRSVNKHMKSIATVLQIVGGATPHNDALAPLRSALHYALRDLPDAIRICHLQPWSIQTSFVTASHESHEQPVEQGIPLFFMFLHDSAITLHQPGDFVGQQLVPQPPA